MKNRLLFIVLLFACSTPQFIKAQCLVTKEVQDDGGITYTGANVSIYKNEDLENGIQSAYLQMIAMQKEKNSSLLKFVFQLSIYSSGQQPEISPSIIEFSFVNGQVLRLDVYNKHPSGTTKISGTTYRTNVGVFQFKMSDYLLFQKANLSTVKIIDNAANGTLVSHPKGDIILKQSNCIAETIN